MWNDKRSKFWVVCLPLIIALAVGIGFAVYPKDKVEHNVSAGVPEGPAKVEASVEQNIEPNVEVAFEQPEISAAQRLSDLADQEFTIPTDQISEDDYETVKTFGQTFVNLYTGAIAEQATVSFERYISNKNLHKFTNKMLELEQRRELKGGFAVNFGLDNEFLETELKRLDDNLYYLRLHFESQGSGMNCKMLVQSENKRLKIADVYFGTKDGVDTYATGHPSVRNLDNPTLWNDQKWVTVVYEKLEQYEADLDSW